MTMNFKPDFKNVLVLENQYYKDYLTNLFGLMLETDFYLKNSSNDFIDDTESIATVRAKSAGIVACTAELQFLVSEFSSLSVSFELPEGEEFDVGDTVCIIKGSAKEILSLERCFLNLFTRACGIAWKAKEYKAKVTNASVLMTRKCLLGLFDKKAGSVGGALTHRLNLNDAVMFKDNHFAVSDLSKIEIPSAARFIDVEANSVEQIGHVLSFYKTLDLDLPKIAMLDNFSPQEIDEILKTYDFGGVYVEVSGGINLDNISWSCSVAA